ncbi:MAG3090 family protein [Mycoplasmopsis bovis]|uniref:MAG3090 family protein n=1 Tax=Mycoplasmopsis bovis TaxID=28903 RepID=UPI001BDDFD91|nr:hypothetical protein [Mycoplasmopsis bovis]MBT1381560.1 hypothetical protein [Mycoplasmopsis bovis]MBT1385985.1 hypothetical protein [Mycoplasmopsis bovis]MBT1392281.1 hypothetical protein [Mycoplasmopsis bovis]
MKKVAIFYNTGAKFPWVLKHPKKDEIIGQFKSRKDAVFWYISFKLETLILLLNEKNEQVGQIAYIKDPDYNNRFIMIPQSNGLDANETYISLCDEFEIDPLKFYKLNTDAQIEEYIKHLTFSYNADPKSYFESKYEIKKRDKEEYLNADAKVKMKQIELAGLSDLNRHTRSEAAKELDDLAITNTVVIEQNIIKKEKTSERSNLEVENKTTTKEAMISKVEEASEQIPVTSDDLSKEKSSLDMLPVQNNENDEAKNEIKTAESKPANKSPVGKIIGFTILTLLILGALTFGIIALLDWLGIVDLLPFIWARK